ncbi:hypothetical protein Trydic_g19404 [Trypoxylus dichotomus]
MLTNNFIRKELINCNVLKRFKHKESHWSIQKKKKTPCDRALEHFDEFYTQVFGKDWPSIRHGLLSKQKYIAVVNNFSDSNETKSKLERIGALNIRTLFELEKQHIKDNYEKLRRKRSLETIWRTDQEMEARLDNIDSNISATNIPSQHSLEHSLSHAEIDFTRVISSRDASSLNLTEFMPVTKLKGKEDWIPESIHSNNYNASDISPVISKEYDLPFPEYLNAYCYEIGNHNDFSFPKNGSTGVLNYYLMDGGSLLPVLALDIRPGDNVLDMCASPGGKSYLALQTLFPDKVVCNDVTKSRTDRIYNVMKQYLYDLEEKWFEKHKLRISLSDGRGICESFDKIIVDVPCTTDRHSLKEPENNIFRPDRIRERLKLPELQSELLVQALKLVKIGGNVVYSTCSLSPIQNDGVVHMALKRIWEETNIEVIIKDLSVGLLQTASVYKLADHKLMKYGHLVVPNLQINFGPTVKQEKTTLRGKKGKRNTIKNVLTSPYTHYWPLLKSEDDTSLKTILKSNLARIRVPKQNTPWEEIKHVPKNQRSAYRKKLSGLDPSRPCDLTSKCICFGINGVTKLLEKDEAFAVLLANDVSPHFMIKHLVDLCVFKRVPFLIVEDFKGFLKEVVGISSAAIAFRKSINHETYIKIVLEKITDIFKSYPIPTTHASYNDERSFLIDASPKEESKQCTSNNQKDICSNVYLHRDVSTTSRAFVPNGSSDVRIPRIDKMDVDSSGFGEDYYFYDEEPNGYIEYDTPRPYRRLEERRK